MKNITQKFIIYSLGLFLILTACSQRHKAAKSASTQVPASGFTSESAFFSKIKALDNGTSERILIQTELKRGYELMSVDNFINRFAGTYVLLPDYNKKEYLGTGSIFLTKETVKLISHNVFAITIDINKPSAPSALLKLEISDLETKQKSGDELIIRLNPEKITDKFAFFDSKTNFPIMASFCHSEDSVVLKDFKGENKSFTVSYYKDNFEAAPSPMAVNSRSVFNRTLKADSTFTISSNSIMSFATKGLYFFTDRSDTSKNNGISLFVTDKRFPRITKAAELLKPIIYISSNEEINEAKRSTEAKKSLDRYWIRLTNGNEDAARQTIKLYYRRVALANQLFTTYKEGWKNDLGMVYIVFGPPDKINKLKDRQIWTYTQNSNFSEINFTFIKRKNIFSENEYELQRYNEYEPIWFPVVDAWRTGAIF